MPCSKDDAEDKIGTELFMDVVPRSWIKSGIIDKGGGGARSGGAELQELSPPFLAEGQDDVPSNV